MTRTEPFPSRRCRTAGADFGLCVIGAFFAFAVQAADVPVAVAPPKPIVIQPSAAMTPAPVPETASAAAQPAAKGARTAKAGKPAKPVKTAARQGSGKSAGKPKANARKR